MRQVNPFELPSVPFHVVKSLPARSGVYFVINDDAVLYIGQAENIRRRWSSHEKIILIENPGKIRIAWVECDICLLDIVEIPLIQQFQPKLNIRHTPNTIEPIVLPAKIEGDSSIESSSDEISESKNAHHFGWTTFDGFEKDCELLEQYGIPAYRLYFSIAFVFQKKGKVFHLSKEEAQKEIGYLRKKHLPLFRDDFWALLLRKGEEAYWEYQKLEQEEKNRKNESANS